MERDIGLDAHASGCTLAVVGLGFTLLFAKFMPLLGLLEIYHRLMATTLIHLGHPQ